MREFPLICPTLLCLRTACSCPTSMSTCGINKVKILCSNVQHNVYSLTDSYSGNDSASHWLVQMISTDDYRDSNRNCPALTKININSLIHRLSSVASSWVSPFLFIIFSIMPTYYYMLSWYLHQCFIVCLLLWLKQPIDVLSEEPAYCVFSVLCTNTVLHTAVSWEEYMRKHYGIYWFCIGCSVWPLNHRSEVTCDLIKLMSAVWNGTRPVQRITVLEEPLRPSHYCCDKDLLQCFSIHSAL